MSYLNDNLTEAKPRRLQLEQGSDEWLAARFEHGTASEIAAVLGCNKYGNTRMQLLDAKKLRIAEEADSGKQYIFDRGHKAEEMARGKVEALIGDDLFRMTLARYIDGVPMLASFDGLTMMRDTSWENKLRNAELTEAVRAGDAKALHKHYRAQMEQQLMVAGADRVFFTIHDDDESDQPEGVWYESDPALRAEIIAAWRMFFQDLEAHVVKAKVEKAVAAPVKALPTLFVQARGEITDTNLPVFVTAATEFLDGINKTPKTDQEFADAKALAEKMRDAAKAITAQIDAMLAQSASIDEAKRTMEHLAERFNKDALALEKAVKSEEETRKTRMLTEAQDTLNAYVATLDGNIGRPLMPQVCGQFAAAIKGKRNIESMQAAIDAELTKCKLAAGDMASAIITNLRTLGADEHLAPDLRTICAKPVEDFAALIAKRKADAEAAIAAKEAAARKLVEEAKEVVAQPVEPVSDPAPTVIEMPPAKVKEIAHQAVIDNDIQIREFLDFRQPPEKLRNTIRAYLVSWEEWKATRNLKQAA